MMEGVLYFVKSAKKYAHFLVVSQSVFLRSHKEEGNLFHTIHSSGWAILRSSPAMQGRREDGPPLFCCGYFPARRLCGILQKQRSI